MLYVRRRWHARIILTLFLTLGGVVDATAQTDQQVDARMDYLFGAHAPYHEFFDRFRKAVAVADKSAVADMVAYPIVVVGRNGKDMTLRSRKDLIAHYDAVFTPKRVAIVERQTYATLFARDEGVMIGQSGEIWFSGICHDSACKDVAIKVTAINPTY